MATQTKTKAKAASGSMLAMIASKPVRDSDGNWLTDPFSGDRQWLRRRVVGDPVENDEVTLAEVKAGDYTHLTIRTPDAESLRVARAFYAQLKRAGEAQRVKEKVYDPSEGIRSLIVTLNFVTAPRTREEADAALAAMQAQWAG